MSAHENQAALPFRAHTILGVCEAIGEDFRFNPLFLRVPFAASVLWSPVWSIAAYLALGGIVFVSRLTFPKVKNSPAAVAKFETAETVVEEERLPLAA